MSIAYLEGKVKYKSTGWLILETEDVGYRVEMNTEGLRIEQALSLYIYHYVREDSQKLIGFRNPQDLEMFERLIGVSGVGPKVGITILDAFPAEKLIKVIQQEDASLLASVKGIGKKGAERIVLELKNKIEEIAVNIGAVLSMDETKSEVGAVVEGIWGEVSGALMTLGYTEAEIKSSVAEAKSQLKEGESGLQAEDLVKKCLSNLAK